jgi:hypothetical protein
VTFTDEHLAGRPGLVRKAYELGGARFNGKHNGDEYRITCLSHDDESPSCDVNLAKGTHICRACSEGGDAVSFYAKNQKVSEEEAIAALREALGLNVEPRPERKIVKTYDYHAADGYLLFQTVRYQPKDFRQRRPDGQGGWLWNLKGLQLVPYRLPQLLAAAEDEPIFIVEGEKDADRLGELGLVATTNPMGAGKWPAHFAEYFAFRRVVIIADNDDAGRKHALDVAGKLRGRGPAGVRILTLDGLPPKGDVSDWLDDAAAGNTAERLLALAQSAEEAKPARRSPLRSYTVAQLRRLAATRPARDLIVFPFMARYESTYLYGYKGHGKSWLSVGMAMVCAQGEGARFLNFRGAGAGVPTLYVDGEMFTRDLDQRVADIMSSSPGLDPADRLHVWTPDAQDDEHTVLNLFSEEGRQMLEEHILDIYDTTGQTIEQVFFDNMASLLWGWDENKQESWARFAPWPLQLRAQRRGNFWVHHANKEFNYRGNSAQIGTMHTILKVLRPKDAAPGANFDFTYEYTRAKPVGLENFNARLEGDLWTVETLGDTADELIRVLHEQGIGPTEIAVQIGKPGEAGKSYVRRRLTKLLAANRGGR